MTTYREILAKSPIVGAPLAEVTDYPFRRIQRLFSDGLVHTEMVASVGLLHENAKTFRMVSTIPDEEPPVGIQIMGSDEETVGLTVRRIAQLRPTIIDINMACPVRKILKSNCGAWLLENPERATRIVKAAKSETDLPIGVKIRLGLSEVTVDRTVDALLEGGVDAISIHGRTAAQMYTGRSDRAAILSVARRVPVPVIASGDVFSTQDVLELLGGGASGVLVARGMMGRPWFLAEAKAAAKNLPMPSRPDVAEIVLLHLRHIVDFYGEDG
ncbi:MAG: tRNA-dihydrouridine synthase family protein, partial [Candidatus Hydrogenedentota bacterium]